MIEAVRNASDFVYGFIFGSIVVLGITYVVAWSYSRIARLPSPTGVIAPSELAQPLPFTMTNEAHEAKAERQFFTDAPPGLGR
jgi:hypothetical protein